VEELPQTRHKGRLSLDEAIVTLEKEWVKAKSLLPQDAIPVFCLHNLNPFVQGVRALLLPNLPGRLRSQISALRLCNPIDLNTTLGSKNSYLGKTVVDLTPHRFVVIGNAQWFCNTLATIGERLSFPDNRNMAASYIKDVVCRCDAAPLGSSLLTGGLATVFAFEVGFLVSKVQGIDTSCSGWLLIACLGALLGICCFLLQEAFESRIVAFCPLWTMKVKLMSWAVFLFALFACPLFFFVPVDSRLLCEAVRWGGLLLMTTYTISTLGQLFFPHSTRGAVLTLWVFLVFVVALLPILDRVFSGK
jgi:hypothetical protein